MFILWSTYFNFLFLLPLDLVLAFIYIDLWSVWGYIGLVGFVQINFDNKFTYLYSDCICCPIFHSTDQECYIEEVVEDEDAKSSKDKKKQAEKGPSLVFKITSKVPYKTVLKGSDVHI